MDSVPKDEDITMSSIAVPSVSMSLRAAAAFGSPFVVRNQVIPIIIVIAIVVLLLLAATVVAAAVILCATNGGVLDTVVQLDSWMVKVVCHRL